ncbi:hypothetical protein K1719_009583 [Acacia pycnantha]|nr:hypothetical protein K1719_009583 [Acacia pycnantha]
MQIVIYGIRIIWKENAMLYLILAMVMKKDFKWVENIQVFGCNLSTTECQVFEALGCSVLSLEEHRLPQALKPTIFFMQDCSYNSILEANWKADLLGNMVVICGNYLKETKDSIDSLNDFIPDDDPALRNLL